MNEGLSITFKERLDTILFMGPPGVGKGTQAQFLASVSGSVHLSSGDIFRSLSPRSDLGQRCQPYLSRGDLLPDRLTVEVALQFIHGLVATHRYCPQDQLLLLDGIPRTHTQAELLVDALHIKAIVLFEVEDENLLVARMRGRAQKENRIDDRKEEILRRRLELYRTESERVLGCYDRSLIHRFDGSAPPLEVFKQLLERLSSLFEI